MVEEKIVYVDELGKWHETREQAEERNAKLKIFNQMIYDIEIHDEYDNFLFQVGDNVLPLNLKIEMVNNGACWVFGTNSLSIEEQEIWNEMVKEYDIDLPILVKYSADYEKQKNNRGFSVWEVF